jgi:hypothetical protein
MPPLSTPTHRTPAFWHARTSHTVSPTNTASPGSVPARRSATSTRSGAGLLLLTSPAEVASSIASSASMAARRMGSSRGPAELASTTRSPAS